MIIDVTPAKLVYRPEITGDGGAVSSVEFTVDMINLLPGYELSSTFSTGLPEQLADTVLESGDMTVEGTVATPAYDVAGVVAVATGGLAEGDLGDNSVTVDVDAAWYQLRSIEGKHIAIVKIGDDGDVFTEAPVCGRVDDVYSCSATFTGDTGGFSRFAVVALTPTVQPTPTPTPTPTATPTPGLVADPDFTPGPETRGGTETVVTPTPEPSPMPVPTIAPTPAPSPTEVAPLVPETGSGGPSVLTLVVSGLVGLIVVRGAFYAFGKLRM